MNGRPPPQRPRDDAPAGALALVALAGLFAAAGVAAGDDVLIGYAAAIAAAIVVALWREL